MKLWMYCTLPTVYHRQADIQHTPRFITTTKIAFSYVRLWEDEYEKITNFLDFTKSIAIHIFDDQQVKLTRLSTESMATPIVQLATGVIIQHDLLHVVYQYRIL